MQGGTPQRVGRYEILGRLASGGMAEVLLGRLQGPHGFERPVVIKRILPHLAVESGVVEMFLDEARLIANLRHPNLIHVLELGREGDDLFIAMEFLEGESVAGLSRRLAAHDELLDFDLAAHIIAEACAGLHAAHEATSTDGRHLEIVHRDISPENLFITYGGAVHVIDFGIATTKDRISRTEAGRVRGKFGYLSPEQLRSKPLDRRVDIFAIGVTLLELAAGRRVYRRPSHAETMMAILEDPTPRLSEFRSGSPEELDAICARAMQKSPHDRFQTASSMRKDLLSFVRKRTDADLTESLAALMRRLFADRVAEKAELLRRVGQGVPVESLPPAEVDLEVDPYAATMLDPRELATTKLAQAVSVTGKAPRGAGRLLWPVLGVAGAIATGFVAVHLWSAPVVAPVDGSSTPVPLAATESAPEPALPSPSATQRTSADVALPGDAGPRPGAAVGRAAATKPARPASGRPGATPAPPPTVW
jgi:serine/threonine-protein kinase